MKEDVKILRKIIQDQSDRLTKYEEALDLKNRSIKEALDIVHTYGQIDGGHHKTWTIDQMVRKLCVSKERYAGWVKEYCNGEHGPDTYQWDTGIAP